ncbi:hypothetical protein AAG570_007433 [Ranatra chinensis]|uniref:C2H2-type domain-containing protein n=1 Tax=Ranatra chinensis TaxID=642074 RepID=A0ABD0XW54_9HEMI
MWRQLAVLTGFRGDLDAYSKTISVAYTGVFVCHHCGFEADCLDDMRRHMRRHRGLSVGDQVSRAEEVRRDTSMCRGLGEASQLSNLKKSKMFRSALADFRWKKLIQLIMETVVAIKLDETTIKQEILDITEIYDDLSPIKDEHCSDDDAGFRDLDASSKTISVAYTGVFVCHHCGSEGKSFEDMRRHMRRHRGLSVGDQVSRVEEVRRDTSMCRGLGEATKFSNLKMSKMEQQTGQHQVFATNFTELIKPQPGYVQTWLIPGVPLRHGCGPT